MQVVGGGRKVQAPFSSFSLMLLIGLAFFNCILTAASNGNRCPNGLIGLKAMDPAPAGCSSEPERGDLSALAN